jgi:NAD(P)-dependent dehydrogenase (short-subunit alcohol dehydrogenase family)
MFGAALIALGLVLPGTPAGPARGVAPRMSIAVFGATGGVGGEAAFQALGRGESVRCLVRDKSRLKVPVGSGGASAGTPLVNDALTVYEGTVTSASDVAKVFESGDVTGAHLQA